ncbi:MAG TPA: OmpW family outer membrane protein [Burkholderiaceae bacterium]|nr:OmpW family outer membrane protein [Burkholderiaceae bacterium]
MNHNKISHRAAWLIVLGAAFTALPAAAQTAGSVMLRAGATQIKPNVDSGALSPPSLPNTTASIRSDTQFAGGITYMVTNNWALDLPLSLPFKHELDGDGAINGVGKIGEVKALPITLLGQYRFLAPDAMLRPYVGAGVTYAKFYKAQSTAALSVLTGGTPANPTTLEIKSKFAATVQLGASFAIDKRWFVDANVTHTFLKTRATLSTGQTLDMKVNPNSYSLALGYTF